MLFDIANKGSITKVLESARPPEFGYKVIYEKLDGMGNIKTDIFKVYAFTAEAARSLFLERNKGKIHPKDIKSVVIDNAVRSFVN